MEPIRLIIGLGNPGREYEDTRHNAGYRWVDAIAARTYAQAGFFSGAAEAYDAYLKLQPEDVSARRERGFACSRIQGALQGFDRH